MTNTHSSDAVGALRRAIDDLYHYDGGRSEAHKRACRFLRNLEEQFDALEGELQNLEAEARRYDEHADATEDEGGHVGEVRYYRNRAEMLGRATSRIRTALALAPTPATLPSMDDYPDAVPGGPVTHPAMKPS